jgi:hypothetical protein
VTDGAVGLVVGGRVGLVLGGKVGGGGVTFGVVTKTVFGAIEGEPGFPNNSPFSYFCFNLDIFEAKLSRDSSISQFSLDHPFCGALFWPMTLANSGNLLLERFISKFRAFTNHLWVV